MYNRSNCQLIKLFIVSNIPKAHTNIIVHSVIPAIPITVLILLRIISLIFQIVSNFNFLNIPFEVILRLFFFTLGIFALSVSAGLSLSSFLHVKYVTNEITIKTIKATKKLEISTLA